MVGSLPTHPLASRVVRWIPWVRRCSLAAASISLCFWALGVIALPIVVAIVVGCYVKFRCSGG
jgi:hypothetical protein